MDEIKILTNHTADQEDGGGTGPNAGLIRKFTNTAVRTQKGYLTNELSAILIAHDMLKPNRNGHGPAGLRRAQNLGGGIILLESLSQGSTKLYNIMQVLTVLNTGSRVTVDVVKETGHYNVTLNVLDTHLVNLPQLLTITGMAQVLLPITVNAHVITGVNGAERILTVTIKAIDCSGSKAKALLVNRYQVTDLDTVQIALHVSN